MSLPDAAYARLLALRTGLRRFEHWSAQQAEAAGLSPAQHQLLLAIRGSRTPGGPTIGEVAEALLLRHHSAVGLIDRAETAGLVWRSRADPDRRVVRLRLTPRGEKCLEALSALHLEELERLALDLPAAWAGLPPGPSAHTRFEADGGVVVARVWDIIAAGGPRILVDRLWPRGVARQAAPFDEWLKEVAPSPELRRWYGHDPELFAEFERRYRRELRGGIAHAALRILRERAQVGPLVLVTATRDVEHSAAAVLQTLLAR